MHDPGMAVAARDLEATLRLFRALGDETRLRLVEKLRGGEQCVCDLTDELDASQPRLSFHLKTLKDAGLVTDRREGRWVYYALNPEAFAAFERVLGELRPARSASRSARTCD
jgi:ArsR family transcriptional regulator, arsenate/arsenite/antimonite-responsive transcriptional repressor